MILTETRFEFIIGCFGLSLIFQKTFSLPREKLIAAPLSLEVRESVGTGDGDFEGALFDGSIPEIEFKVTKCSNDVCWIFDCQLGSYDGKLLEDMGMV